MEAAHSGAQMKTHLWARNNGISTSITSSKLDPSHDASDQSREQPKGILQLCLHSGR